VADLHVPDHGRWRWGERCAHRRRGTRRPRCGGRRRRRGQRCRRRCRRWNKRHRRCGRTPTPARRRRRIPDLGRRRRVGLLGEWRIGLTRTGGGGGGTGNPAPAAVAAVVAITAAVVGGPTPPAAGVEEDRASDRAAPSSRRGPMPETGRCSLVTHRPTCSPSRCPHTGLRRIAHVLGHLRRVHLGRRAERPRRCALVQLVNPFSA